jgi:hypothetical protein
MRALEYLLENDNFEYTDVNGVDVPTYESIARVMDSYANYVNGIRRYAVYLDLSTMSAQRKAEYVSHVRANLNKEDPDAVFFIFGSNETRIDLLHPSLVSDEAADRLQKAIENLK